jgi:hypothetical protein
MKLGLINSPLLAPGPALTELAFQEAVPQLLWQNVPHLSEHRGNIFLQLATDNDAVVRDIQYGTMLAYFSALDVPHKDNFLSYLHNLLLNFLVAK